MWDGCTLARNGDSYLICGTISSSVNSYENFFNCLCHFLWDMLEKLLMAGCTSVGIHNAGVFVVLCDEEI